MKRLWVLLLLLPLVQVAGQPETVREVAFHQFQEISFSESRDPVYSCETGRFSVSELGTVFTFTEERRDDDPALYQEYVASGCGTMRKQVDVLTSADHLTVRFQADRVRNNFNSAPEDGELVQDLVVRDAGFREIQSRAIFEPTDPSRDPQPFAFTFVGNVGGSIALDWVFQDLGLQSQSPAGGQVAGQSLEGTVRDVVVEAIGPATDSHVHASQKDTRDGTRLSTLHEIAVQLPEFAQGPAAIRTRVVPELTLVRVLAPDGTDLGAPSTFEGGVLGYDHDGVVVEVRPGYVQATVPQALTAQYGPGEYRFVFEESRGLEVSPALLPFSIILLAAPLPFAALAWIESRAFRKEAFGGYARSARNLQYGVVLVFLYYLAVVASAAVGGRLDLMALVPVPLEGVLLYLQLIVAGIAFTALWLVARELYLLVKPRPSDDAL